MEAYPLLNQMIQDMETQSDLYKPTSFWQGCSEMIITSLEEDGIENFRASEKSLFLFVPTYGFPLYLTNKKGIKLKADVLNNLGFSPKMNDLKMQNFLSGRIQAIADYRTFIASSKDVFPYTDRLSESRVGNPLEQFEFDGRLFSRSFLNYLLGMNFLKKNVRTDRIKTVMEIGGGFGSLGEILLGDTRNNCFYINADIPPVSFISAHYLKQVFGDDAVGGYKELRGTRTLDIETLMQKYRALNLCAWQVPALEGKIDLFVNFISFQEMEPEVVKNYCRHVRRLKPEFVLLRNIKEGKAKKSQANPVGVINPILGKDYNEFFPEYELVDTDTTVFGYLTDDGFHSELRLYQRAVD